MKKKLTLWSIHFFIVFFVYHIFLNEIFPVDNIIGISQGNTLYSTGFSLTALLSGRGVNYIISVILGLLKYDWYKLFKFSQIFKMMTMALFSTIVAVEIQKRIISDDKYKIIGINLAALVAVVNPFCVQIYTFATIDWGIDFLMAALAIYFLGEKKYILAFVFSFLTINSYQAFITLIAVIGICFILLDCDFEIKKECFKEVIKLAIITIIPAIMTIGIMHIKVDSAGTSAVDVKQMSIDANNGTGILQNTVDKILAIYNKYVISAFVNGYSMIGFKAVLLFFCISLLIIVGILIYQKKFLAVLMALIGIIIMVAAPFSIGLIQAGMYLPTRIVFPFFLSLACISFLVIKVWKYKYSFIYSIIVLGFLIILSNSALNVGVDCYIIYNNDIAIGDEISDMIRIYEEDSNNKVDTIKVLNWSDRVEKMHSVYYNQVHYSYNPEEIMTKTLWSDAGIAPLFKFVSGREYTVEYMDLDEYNSLFKDYGQGNIILSEQVKFDGNVMYLDIR